MLAGLRADLDGLHAEVRERADVHVIHLGVAANLLVTGDKLRAVLVRELAAGRLEDVRANRQLKADILINLRVLVGNRAGADHSDSHGTSHSSGNVRAHNAEVGSTMK